MKKLLFILIVIPLLLSGRRPSDTVMQAAIVSDGSSGETERIVHQKCTYTAMKKDTKTDKTGAIYYLAELYSDAGSAHKSYAAIVSSNASMPGQSNLPGVGDEAWLHSDGENFHLIMFRKGNKAVRIKINKVTSKTSLDELKNVAREIASKL